MLNFGKILTFFRKSVDKRGKMWYHILVSNDPLAQTVEHLTFNQGVRSSSLRWVTKNKITALRAVILFYPSRRLGMESRVSVYGIGAAAWHHLGVFSLRLDSIRDFVAIPYRSKLRIPYTLTRD